MDVPNTPQLSTQYLRVRDRIKIGDVIVFSGFDLASTVIKVATQSSYVHVAIVVSRQSSKASSKSSLQVPSQDPSQVHVHNPMPQSVGDRWSDLSNERMPEQVTDHLLIADAHIDIRLPSVGSGKRKFGVQIQWLINRLACAKGPVWWASLKTPLTPKQIETLQRWLWHMEAQDTPYDFIQMLGAGLDVCDRLGLENTPDESAFFCSELVACALQKIGVVSDRINASEQTPADLMNFSCFEPPILIQDED